MREIDEVRIEGNVMTIYDTKGERHRFKMGVPEQVYEEVVAKLSGAAPEDRFAEARALGRALGEAARTFERYPLSAHDQIAHDGTAERRLGR